MLRVRYFEGGTHSGAHGEPRPKTSRRKVGIADMLGTGREARRRGGEEVVEVDGKETRRQGRDPRRDTENGIKRRTQGREAARGEWPKELKQAQFL